MLLPNVQKLVPASYYTPHIQQAAAEYGHVDILQYILETNGEKKIDSSYVCYGAGMGGHVPVMEWLLSNTKYVPEEVLTLSIHRSPFKT